MGVDENVADKASSVFDAVPGLASQVTDGVKYVIKLLERQRRNCCDENTKAGFTANIVGMIRQDLVGNADARKYLEEANRFYR